MIRSERPSREFARHSDFERGWYAQAPVPSLPPPSLAPRRVDFGGYPGWSAWLGALSGGLGGVLMLIASQSILTVRHSNIDVVRLLGNAVAHAHVRFPDARIGGVLGAAALGAILGAPLGLLSRRLLRIVPRLLFFTLLSSALWLFVRALVIGKMATWLAVELPFGPILVGSILYGACIAVVVPPRASR